MKVLRLPDHPVTPQGKHHLVGGFNPLKNISQNKKSSPNTGENEKIETTTQSRTFNISERSPKSVSSQEQKKNPWTRAVRVSKICLAAVISTLQAAGPTWIFAKLFGKGLFFGGTPPPQKKPKISRDKNKQRCQQPFSIQGRLVFLRILLGKATSLTQRCLQVRIVYSFCMFLFEHHVSSQSRGVQQHW